MNRLMRVGLEGSSVSVSVGVMVVMAMLRLVMMMLREVLGNVRERGSLTREWDQPGRLGSMTPATTARVICTPTSAI